MLYYEKRRHARISLQNAKRRSLLYIKEDVNLGRTYVVANYDTETPNT